MRVGAPGGCRPGSGGCRKSAKRCGARGSGADRGRRTCSHGRGHAGSRAYGKRGQRAAERLPGPPDHRARAGRRTAAEDAKVGGCRGSGWYGSGQGRREALPVRVDPHVCCPRMRTRKRRTSRTEGAWAPGPVRPRDTDRARWRRGRSPLPVASSDTRSSKRSHRRRYRPRYAFVTGGLDHKEVVRAGAASSGRRFRGRPSRSRRSRPPCGAGPPPGAPRGRRRPGPGRWGCP
jgi:hypothetical protein